MTPRPCRPAALNGPWLAFLASLAVFAVLVGLLLWPGGDSSAAHEPLVVYCAAGIKEPVEAVARDYERRYGVPVQLQYGGSQTLLANIEVSHRGDLYLPADDSYVRAAQDKGLIAETIPLARMRPILAVARGNPRGITSIDALLRPGVRVALANPGAAAVGKLTRDALRRSGHWAELEGRATVSKPTVNDVASAVQVGAADAGFVWDATVRQTPDLEAVSLPQFDGLSAQVSVAVLDACTQPAAALRFARYLAARDRGLPEFGRHGFEPVDGDEWAEKPEVRLLAGAMLRPAIAETVKEFERREGATVAYNYNGCGILVAQMRGGERPDAYFACDQSFMDQVSDLFLDPVALSGNRLVVLVPRGNPHGIQTLEDLARPGLRVGVGNEKQCALGVLTQKTLEQGGYQDRVMPNVKVRKPTGDMLVNDLLAGALDAVVAYVSNRTAHEDELDAVAIDVPCARAVQPFAVGRASKHKYLTGRLLAAIRASRARFESAGFTWQPGSK
jgi:molybdenum ABC transporter molybdate-binding protein